MTVGSSNAPATISLAVKRAIWAPNGNCTGLRNLYRPTHSCCLTRSLSRLVGRLDGDGRAVYLGAPHPPTSTILPLGGIPGSSSRIPTLGLSPNRAAPAPPGFITVTVLSTSSNNGRCVWPYTITSARGNAAQSFAGVGLPSDPRSSPSSAKRYKSPRPAVQCQLA